MHLPRRLVGMSKNVKDLCANDNVERSGPKGEPLAIGHHVDQLSRNEIATDVPARTVAEKRTIWLISASNIQDGKRPVAEGADPLLKNEPPGSQHQEIRVCQRRVQAVVRNSDEVRAWVRCHFSKDMIWQINIMLSTI